MKFEFPSDASSKILLFLLKNGVVKKTDLLSISTMHTVEKTLLDLNTNGFIEVKEEFIGRRTYKISLTSKGHAVAEQLKKAEEAAKGENVIEISNKELNDWTEKFKEATKGMSLLYRVNVFQDHITIKEDKDGGSRVISIYVKVNGHNIKRLWCDLDESFECIHAGYAWTLAKVQEMYANNIMSGGVSGK